MDFFGIGISEILLILVIALMIWGPKRLPEIARTLGKMTRTLKKTSYNLTSQVTRELDIQETDDKEKPHLPQTGKKNKAKPEKE
ncbi:MAG: Sec-independent protein translocase protein TatB [Dehalococcoidales bacterium]|nr:Sec-independent protein translocase protein TatB [Dehalococcoidales bacterium]MDP7286245.1 Sec-independent protein translocase protein TatB [Dehalococcoidales bacterium]MDP7415857.1 Sec-independent protein translocase protein TatB [Dehalococcoidales bacterium]